MPPLAKHKAMNLPKRVKIFASLMPRKSTLLISKLSTKTVKQLSNQLN